MIIRFLLGKINNLHIKIEENNINKDAEIIFLKIILFKILEYIKANTTFVTIDDEHGGSKKHN